MVVIGSPPWMREPEVHDHLSGYGWRERRVDPEDMGAEVKREMGPPPCVNRVWRALPGRPAPVSIGIVAHVADSGFVLLLAVWLAVRLSGQA